MKQKERKAARRGNDLYSIRNDTDVKIGLILDKYETKTYFFSS